MYDDPSLTTSAGNEMSAVGIGGRNSVKALKSSRSSFSNNSFFSSSHELLWIRRPTLLLLLVMVGNLATNACECE